VGARSREDDREAHHRRSGGVSCWWGACIRHEPNISVEDRHDLPFSGSRVAAPVPHQIERQQRTAPVSREQCRSLGTQFVEMLRGEIDEAAHGCAQLPEPKQMYKDIARGRDASAVTFGAALVGLALSPDMTDRRFAKLSLRLVSWLQALRPRTAPSLMSAWADETHAQASADVSQALAVTAIERRDRGALDAAIAETASHIAAMQQLLAAMQMARRSLTAPVMTRVVVNAARSRVHQ
jgi:hypothetical protein